ncbi:MAG: SynChlorMet cassette protein ScmC [Methanobacteriota archaeon]
MTLRISFSPELCWSMYASPDCTRVLDQIGTLLSLSPSSGSERRIIRISSLLAHEPVRSSRWRLIQSPYGVVAVNTVTGCIEIGVHGEDQGRTEYVAWIIKSLFIGVSTLLLSSGCIMLHAATLVRDGGAVLILASSGGGKTTTAMRVPPPWIAPGDENALVLRTSSGGYLVHVLPTASIIATGTAQMWNITRSYPLMGICILIQSDEDRIIRCTPGKAAGLLTGSAHQVIKNQEIGMKTDYKQWKKAMIFSAACKMAVNVPVFLLYATLTGRFWEEIESMVFFRG